MMVAAWLCKAIRLSYYRENECAVYDLAQYETPSYYRQHAALINTPTSYLYATNVPECGTKSRIKKNTA